MTTEAVEEDAPLGDHQANCMIVKASRSIGGVIRTLKIWVGSNIGEPVDDDTIMTAWSVELAAGMMIANWRGSDGSPAYERIDAHRREGHV